MKFQALVIFILSIVSLSFGHLKIKRQFSYIIYPNELTTSEVGKSEFYEIVNSIHRMYLDSEEIIIPFLDWDYPYMSAWADKKDDHFTINFWGGFARLPLMTKLTWEFIVCHEIGHIVGGYPKQTIKDYDWASSEGQADHFAVTECLPRYYRTSNALKDREIVSLPIEISRCSKFHHDPKEEKVCLAILKGVRIFGHVSKFMKITDKVPEYGESQEIVSETILNSYPKPSCRVNIAFEGVLCLDKTQKECKRSRCWFKD